MSGISHHIEFVIEPEKIANNGISAKVVDIRQYVNSTYGQTIQQVKLAAWVSVFVASAVILLVLFLFTRLLIAQERNDISLRKAIGFTDRDIHLTYAKKYVASTLIGISSGLFLGFFLGEGLAGIILGNLGADSFHFIVNKASILIIPVITVVAVSIAVRAGLRAVKDITPVECCYGRE